MSFFSPALFTFFEELAANNTREWFAANKPRYERDVRDPMLAFVAAMGAPLATISPSFLADPRPVGGSMFRIHRDTRFSKDKRPYKPYVAAQFRHRVGKDVHAPGFYLHLGPEERLVGLGLWHPEPDVLRKVRDAIVAEPAAWGRARAGLPLGGESTKRPPPGYPTDHPHADDLRRKDFVVMDTLTREQVCADDLVERVTARFRAGAPLMELLTRAVGLPW